MLLGRVRSTIAFIVLVATLVSACEPFPERGVPPFPVGVARAMPTSVSATPEPEIPTPVRITPLPAPESPRVETPTPAPPDDVWLERAGLGDHAPAEEDGEALRQAALTEASVVLYSDSSRALTSLEALTEAQPGLQVEGYTWSAADIALRLAGEVAAGDNLADVYLAGDPIGSAELEAQGGLWAYEPPELAEVIPTNGTLPEHHWSALMVVTGGSGAPIDNWWDLTRPEWAGRVALSDPLVDDRTLYLFATTVLREDEMAAAYRAEFDQEPPLDADCGDAGCLWVRALLANGPALLHGDAEVARWVGEGGETRLGLCGYEQYAKVRRGELSFTPLWQLAPAAGLRWPSVVAIVDRSPHPNAAKLAVRWLYGDSSGLRGYAPWFEAGYYPARSDVPDPSGAVPRDRLRERLWDVDAAALAALLPAFRNRIAGYLGRPLTGDALTEGSSS